MQGLGPGPRVLARVRDRDLARVTDRVLAHVRDRVLGPGSGTGTWPGSGTGTWPGSGTRDLARVRGGLLSRHRIGTNMHGWVALNTPC